MRVRRGGEIFLEGKNGQVIEDIRDETTHCYLTFLIHRPVLMHTSILPQ